MKAQITALLFALPLLAGCVNSRIHLPYDPSTAGRFHAVAHARPAVNGYPVLLSRPRQLALEEDAAPGYARLRLQFPSAGDNGQPGNLVSVDYYRSARTGRKPLVIVYPIWNSYTYPSDKITSTFLQRSGGAVNVFYVHGERDLFDWAALRGARDEADFRALLQSRVAARALTVVDDTRRLIDWAQSQDDIDPGRIGLVGFSVGAVVASYVVTVEPRLAATALVMGAAQFHEILAVCDGEPGRLRRAVMERFGWSSQHYRQVLEEMLAPVDVGRRGTLVDPARIILMDAHFDTCMPASARDALWQGLGRPERISFLYDHKTAFLSMTLLGSDYMNNRLYDFLQAAFR